MSVIFLCLSLFTLLVLAFSYLNSVFSFTDLHTYPDKLIYAQLVCTVF